MLFQKEIPSFYSNKIKRKILLLLVWIVIVGIIWFISSIHETDKKVKEDHELVEAIGDKIFTDHIRVLLTANDGATCFKDLSIKGLCAFKIKCNGKMYDYDAGKTIHIDSKKMANKSIEFIQEDDTQPCFEIMESNQVREQFYYRGNFECFGTPDGIMVVNEVPVEEYLYGVVPSEMPSGYPKEALKVQAICARTYAYEHLDSYAYDEVKANVDDTVRFQVYGSIQEQTTTNEAVNETTNEIIFQEGDIVPCMYYSTSCKAIEKSEPWYSWNVTYQYDGNELADRIKKCYESFPGLFESYVEGEVTGIQALERNEDGYITKLSFETTNGSSICDDDYGIRYCMSRKNALCKRQDGYDYPLDDLLPSSHFTFTYLTMSDGKKGLYLQGGGFGHGNGVSQNGAKHLANMGYSAKDILTIYLGECVVDKIN